MFIRRFDCAAFLLILFLMAAIYTVKIANVVEVRSASSAGEEFQSPDEDDDDLKEEMKAATTARDAAEQDRVVMGDKLDHVMWFMQVTDLHISSFVDKGRIEQLREFCADDVFTIRPSVVLASGDLTDGRSPNTFGSQQLKSEWQLYKDTVRKTGVLKLTNWLDIRGNHDNFDVPSIDSDKNLFRKYSVQGPRHARSYLHEVVQGGDSYSFIAVDACLEPGPRRPFNFIGMLSERDINDLAKLARESRLRSNVTIWFGHYPTSTILSPTPGIRHLMKRGYVYLCGHFHTFGGWARHMYTIQKYGFLELELGDWKDSRLSVPDCPMISSDFLLWYLKINPFNKEGRYRVAAVDHGLLSFVDVRHGSWPIVLITNPKNVQFLLGDREPSHRMIRSTHIRLLVFSTANITEVHVSVDDGAFKSCVNVQGPLYVVLWRTQDYRNGVHIITARAKDSLGRETVVAHSFALDDSRINFDLLPRFFLMCSVVTVVQVILGLTICGLVLPLCYVRLMHHYVKVGKLARPRYSNLYGRAILRRLWLLASIDRMFYPIVLMTIYVPLGPWFLGYLLNDYVGVVFAWGMFVNDSYLPGGMTFVHAVIHLWTFNAPLMFLLATALDHRFHQLTTTKTTIIQGHGVHVSIFLYHLVHTLPFVVFFMFNVYLASQTYSSYGPLAFFINPVKTWSLVAALVLWLRTNRVPAVAFRSAFTVFPPNFVDDSTLMRHRMTCS